MNRLINRLFFIPVFFVVMGFVFFSAFYAVYVENFAEKWFDKTADIIVEHKKEDLKIELNSIRDAFEEIRFANYTIFENSMYEVLKIFLKNFDYSHRDIVKYFQNYKTDNMFLFIISKKLVYPEIKEQYIYSGKTKHLIVEYKHKKYLAYELKDKDKILGIAVSLDKIDNLVKKEIVEYVRNIDKNKSSYVVVVHITNWNATKGVFAKTLYHPIKSMVNKSASLDKTDINGYPYRKKYFECLKRKNECFVTYHFKNPLSGKIEKKFSYFTVFKPYNFMLMKGYYCSSIQKDINEAKKHVVSNIRSLYRATLYIMILLVLINSVIAFFISRKIKNQILKEYNILKNNYEQAKKELLNKVYYDPLTGLPNRYKLFEDVDSFESLCVVDIDDFSYINDIYGFDTGNKILIYLSRFLNKKYKNVYRTGSDEFTICLDYKITGDEIKQLINTNLFYEDIKINLSAGVSYLKEKLFETAETALKLALRDKNIKYKIYDESIQHIQKERIKKIQHLSKILEEENVIPYYQCIVNKNGEVIKYEALMRLKEGSKIYSPFQFMDAIIEAKLYNRFSRMMIKKVFSEIKHFSVPVSINLSFSDIADQITRETVLDLLKTNTGGKIVFEILETENIEQFDIVYNFINEVKKYGVKIAIDDFGSGYSNLVNILRLYPDYLKIDASLVKNLDDQKYVEIVKFIAGFAHKFNIITTAEFVSDKEKFKILKNIEIDEFQGYYFCEPQPLKT